jgi:hypothetical protein
LNAFPLSVLDTKRTGTWLNEEKRAAAGERKVNTNCAVSRFWFVCAVIFGEEGTSFWTSGVRLLREYWFLCENLENSEGRLELVFGLKMNLWLVLYKGDC